MKLINIILFYILLNNFHLINSLILRPFSTLSSLDLIYSQLNFFFLHQSSSFGPSSVSRGNYTLYVPLYQQINYQTAINQCNKNLNIS